MCHASTLVQAGQIQLADQQLFVLQVAAKIVVDAETDEHGKLTADTEKNYKAEMKHEHGIYRNIKGSLQSMPTGIPATYCSGA